MNGLANHERRFSYANDEIIIEDFNTSSVSMASSFGRNVSASSEPTLNRDSATRINNDTESQSQSISISQLQTCRWRIEDKDVSDIPEFYPPVSYPLIVRDREVSEIGDRLWAFLRTHGIRSAYDRKQGRLLCCTERVAFVVQFWRRRSPIDETTNNSQSDEEIILEIQRRKGCSWAMQKIRSALKRSIIQQQQHSHSAPNLRNSRVSQITKPSFFPPPPQRFNSSNAIGMIKPLLLPSRFFPLSCSDGAEIKDREPSTEEVPSTTSSLSWDENTRRLRKKADLPPAARSITAVRGPFRFPPPLRQKF